MISEFLSILFGIITFLPYLIMFIILVIYRKRGIAPASILKKAADLTTPILFFSVYFLALSIFGKGSGIYISLIAVFIVIVFAVLEWKRVKDFQIIRLLRKTWRLYFVLLTVAYIVLLIGGITIKIVSYTK